MQHKMETKMDLGIAELWSALTSCEASRFVDLHWPSLLRETSLDRKAKHKYRFKQVLTKKYPQDQELKQMYIVILRDAQSGDLCSSFLAGQLLIY